MSEILFHITTTIVGVLLANYIHAFIFAAFKADRYEKNLIERIARRVVELQNEASDESS